MILCINTKPQFSGNIAPKNILPQLQKHKPKKKDCNMSGKLIFF